MIVVYKLETLAVEHCVHISADTFTDYIDADPDRGWVRFEGNAAPHEIGIKIIDGEAVAMLKQPLQIDTPSSCVIGETVVIENVPAGTHVWGDAGAGIVDASETVEVSFETPGVYTIAFSHPEYLFKEIEIEAHSL